MCPNWLRGSFLEQLLSMCGGRLAVLLEVAAGRQGSDSITPRRAPDGLVDSLKFLLGQRSQTSRQVIRLLTYPEERNIT